MKPPSEFAGHCTDLYRQLCRGLERINKSADAGSKGYKRQVELVRASVQKLRGRVLSETFSKPGDEIHFMKRILPEFLSLLIYYSEKSDWQANRLIASAAVREELLARQLGRVETFFRENIEFIRYYYSGKTFLDKHYFLRSQHPVHLAAPLPGEWTDPVFCTGYAYKLGMLLAYSRLEKELQVTKEMAPVLSTPVNEMEERLEWTDSKTGLLELIYSLQEQKAFNHGKADIKTIAEHFARAFSIDLGNVYVAFQKILFRKGGSTNYIDQLKERLLDRIDQIEMQQRK